MIKKLCFASFAILATVALAHHVLAVGTHGTGVAGATDGRVGRFNHSVVKYTSEGHSPQFAGRARFEQIRNTAGPRVLIEMGVPTAVGVSGNLCEFSGRGVLVRMVEGHNVTVHGQVSVLVRDRRNPHHSPHNDRDTYRIRFTDGHNVNFGFEGLVREGDLTVFSHRRPH